MRDSRETTWSISVINLIKRSASFYAIEEAELGVCNSHIDCINKLIPQINALDNDKYVTPMYQTLFMAYGFGMSCS